MINLRFLNFKSNWKVILVKLKQEVERKCEWFCGVNVIQSNFKVEWQNGVLKICFLQFDFDRNLTLIFAAFNFFKFFI